MAKNRPELIVPDPAVLVPDDEKILAEILVADVAGLSTPLVQLIGDRVFCPVVGTRPNGVIEPDFRNDKPALIIRPEDGGGRSKGNMVSETFWTIFATGGRTEGMTDRLFVQAKQTYRALVHRLGLIDNEAVASGVLLGAFELSMGRPETEPDTGWPVYRSRWRMLARRKE